MGILQSVMIVSLLLGTLGSGMKENMEYPVSYAYFPGYTRFEDNMVLDMSAIADEQVYYKILGEATEYVLPVGTEEFAIPEDGRYRFYVYTNEGMIQDVTREFGVSMYDSVMSTDMEEDNRRIIPVQKK